MELLLYLALAGLSFAFAIGAVSGSLLKAENAIASFEIAQFVNQVNTMMLTSASQFNSYIPAGVCNSTLSGSLLSTEYGDFYFTWPLKAQEGTLCPDGAYARLRISVANGTAYLSRG